MCSNYVLLPKNTLPVVMYKYQLENKAQDEVPALAKAAGRWSAARLTLRTRRVVTERAGPSRPGVSPALPPSLPASEITQLPCCPFFFFFFLKGQGISMQ